MTFPAHQRYRDSGIQWLGLLPQHWVIERLGRRVSLLTQKAEAQTRPVALENIESWSGRLIESDTKFQNDGVSFEKGDVLFGKLRPYLAKVYAAQFDGQAVGDFHVIRPGKTLSPCFLTYWLLTREIISLIDGSTYGAKMPRASWDFLRDIQMPCPPLAEQNNIVAFLDRETANIDALIEEQRRLIALLKEKRQAVISHTVTKGLDPHAPIKNSGIEWLGEVPAHWQLLPLRRVVRQFVDYRGATPNKMSEGVPLITAAQIKEGRIDHSLDPVFISEDEYADRMTRGFPSIDDLLLTTEAPLGEVALVTEARIAPGQRIILMKLTEELITSRYLHAHFRSDFGRSELWTRASGSTASGIRADRLRASAVLVPPLSEQRQIVEHIEHQTKVFDEVFAVANAAIDLLRERRAALISAAVTGKIEVRNSAPLLPFPIELARARGLVAAEIIECSAHQATFGRVKLQKIAFLAEAYVGIPELAGSYSREAAGPLDRAMIADMESGARSIADVVVDQSLGTGTAVTYRPSQQRGVHRQELTDWLRADRKAKLDKLIADFAGLTTKGAEAVATLYGVWNDALIEGITPTEEDIISGFLNDWHPEKREKFRADELRDWLGWMRRHGILPTGSGPRTTSGRLFA